MTRRTLGAAALTTAAAIAVASAPVGATSTTAVKRTTQPRIDMLGGFSFVPNRYTQDKTRYAKDVYSLRSGATITLRNLTPEEPHTVSVIGRTQMPKTAAAIDGCYAPGGVCAKLGEAHQFPDGPGDPAVPLVNKGAVGLDVKGDSIYLKPNARERIKLSAKKGSTLSFFCVIHPWMQARITVR